MEKRIFEKVGSQETGKFMSILTPIDKDFILNTLHSHYSELRTFGVRRLGLFGSYARGEERPDSDIDLLVEFAPDEATFRNFMELTFYLESLFDPYQVDVVSMGGLSPYIGPFILKEVEYALA